MAKLSEAGVKGPKADLSPLASLRAASESMKIGVSYTIHGPPGHGKTWCAATGSKNWPNGPLDDQLWITLDRGALAGIVAKGVEVPYNIDIPLMLQLGEAKNIVAALTLAYKTARAAMQQIPGITTIVLDTISALDDMLVSYLDANCPTTKSGARNTMAMWIQLRTIHTKFFETMVNFPCNLIFLCHSKAIDTDTDDALQRAKIRSMTTPGGSCLIPAITGQSIGMYTKNVSLEMVMLARPDPENKGQFLRELHSGNVAGYRTKNRFHGIVPDVMEADMSEVFHLVNAKILQEKTG